MEKQTSKNLMKYSIRVYMRVRARVCVSPLYGKVSIIRCERVCVSISVATWKQLFFENNTSHLNISEPLATRIIIMYYGRGR